jgi:hypothetical protein
MAFTLIIYFLNAGNFKYFFPKKKNCERKIKDFFGECLGIFFLGVIKSSKSINYLTYMGRSLPLSFKWSDTRCPPTTLKKFYECALHPWMLMMWTCEILFQGKTWGKTKKKVTILVHSFVWVTFDLWNHK